MEDKEVNGESNEMSRRSIESHSKSKHASNFLPTSRRIVQFSNGKVCFLNQLSAYCLLQVKRRKCPSHL